MASWSEVKANLNSRAYQAQLRFVYGEAAPIPRMEQLLHQLQQDLGVWESAETIFVSAPGRSELGGNHTDHQHGRVLACATDRDCLACAAPRQDGKIRLLSRGFAPCEIDLAQRGVREAEQEAIAALLRGIAEGLLDLGYAFHGCDICLDSIVAPGSGLSSSAAFECSLALLFARLAKGPLPSPYLLAKLGHVAENRYFGKPSGLMDQTICALGGAAVLDFADPEQPAATRIPFAPEAAGYALVLIETGSSHANLTAAYAAIPAEMHAVAACFGKAVLGEVSAVEFAAEKAALAARVSSRALQRAEHFFAENARVEQERLALAAADFDAFLALVRASGRSSEELLQNVLVPGAAAQPYAEALADAAALLNGAGAVRVHGGGFAGAIQAYVPLAQLSDFRQRMEQKPGRSCCRLQVRQAGTVILTEEREDA